jgi:hypothetical protein
VSAVNNEVLLPGGFRRPDLHHLDFRPASEITITKPNYIPYTAVTGGTFTTPTWFGNLLCFA